MESILIKNPLAIVTCDPQDRVLWQQDLLIEGPRITRISANTPSPAGCRIIDGTGKIVYPGLVNTHHHFFQSFVRNMAQIECYNMTLLQWLDEIYRIFVTLNAEDIYYASLTAMADLVKHGCTTAFDLQYCYTPHTGFAPIDLQMEAAKQMGIRFHAGRGTNTLPRSMGSTIPDGMVETTETFVTDVVRLIKSYHDDSEFSMRQIVAAPCQPTNCYPETFQEAVRLSRETGIHLHTHLAEGENPAMEQRYGMRSLNWCEQQGFVGEKVWFGHCWELNDSEFQKLAELGSGISHCPEAAMLAGAPILPLKRLKELGVPVGLGCDGSATNDGSNLLSSIRVGFLLQAFYSKERGGCVPAYELLRAATVNGARVLGRKDIGSLEEGKAADLFMIDASSLQMTGTAHDPKNLLGRVGCSDTVWLTMVNGKIVYENGMLTTVSERELAEKARRIYERLLSQIPNVSC